MRILTFDCSIKSTGWAAKWQLPDGNYNVASGKESFSSVNKNEVAGWRFVRFVDFLQEMFQSYEPEIVVCEQPHFRGGRGTEALVGLCTRVEEYCARYNVPYQQLHSATLKKFATGSGRADKEDMKAAAERRWKHYDKTEDAGGDEADALNMLDWAIANIQSL